MYINKKHPRYWCKILLLFPKKIRRFLNENAFLAGGWAASFNTGERPKDYDVFFRTPEASKRFLDLIGDKYDRKTLWATSKRFVNVITAITGEPEAVISVFDFKHTQNFYDPRRKLLVVSKESFEKEMVFNPNARTPASSLSRVYRFLQRGYTISEQNWDDVCRAALQQVVKEGKVAPFYMPPEGGIHCV